MKLVDESESNWGLEGNKWDQNRWTNSNIFVMSTVTAQMCTIWPPGAQGSQKAVLEPLELEIPMGAKNQTRVIYKSNKSS